MCFCKKNKPHKNSEKAFSLLEFLVVLFIIAFVFTSISRRVIRLEPRVRATFEKLIRLNRRLVIASKLHSKTYRLAIQLDKEGPEQYWVEKREKEPSSSEESDKKEKDQKTDFILDDSFYSRPEVIPSFLSIVEMESPVWKENKTEGVVYIYYYPKGLIQYVSIRFLRPDNQGRWTLSLDPVTKNFNLVTSSKDIAEEGIEE